MQLRELLDMKLDELPKEAFTEAENSMALQTADLLQKELLPFAKLELGHYAE